jgi:hypothetical protein
MKDTRIAWTRREGLGRSGWDGTVGKRHLFTIEKSVTRGQGWVLGTRLPMRMKTEVTVNDEAPVLKQLAERMLAVFVESLGATFGE